MHVEIVFAVVCGLWFLVLGLFGLICLKKCKLKRSYNAQFQQSLHLLEQGIQTSKTSPLTTGINTRLETTKLQNTRLLRPPPPLPSTSIQTQTDYARSLNCQDSSTKSETKDMVNDATYMEIPFVITQLAHF